MSRLEIEKVFQYIKMNFGRFMAKITPAWKMRKLHLWWFHEVNGNAFRRIHAINEELFEKDARTYHCNMCGRVVFKGSIKYGIVMNCPNCGCQFGVALDFPHKFERRELIQAASDCEDKVDENTKLIRL